MKIVICNIPLQGEEIKTNYPPLGALSIIQSLQSAGYSSDFYDINFFRPSEEEIRNYFLNNKFDIVGISATVSTSYKFVKRLASIIKSVSPKATIVVGGAITASSEIILKLTKVDFCVIGEGEKIARNLVNYISCNANNKNDEALQKIRGLCFLNKKGDVVFTGYEQQLTIDEIQNIDYSIIEKYSDINQYITSPFIYEPFKYDQRSFQEHRKNKKIATVVTSRGCINRCTFCHRRQQGIIIFPVDRVIGYIHRLIEDYNLGFISFGDEDFGASKRWLEEFIEKVKPLDILYRIAGICCENINPLLLKKLKEGGCLAIYCGLESGSDKMLEVMEKRADVNLNERVAKWTNETGLQTVPAFIVGMPGESYETIKKTSQFINRITESLPREPLINVKALVALPGAPTYEYARFRGLLGKTLEDEEKYLLEVFDQGGESLRQLNLTDYPYFIVLGWIRTIYWAMRYNYYKKHNFSQIPLWKLFYLTLQIVFKRRKIDKRFYDGIFSNSLLYYLRDIIAPLAIMYKNYKESKSLFIERCFELLIWPFTRREFKRYISLRDFLYEKVDYLKNISNEDVRVLRLGR